MTLENGNSNPEVDKYGFCGGSQYTLPGHAETLSAAKVREREIKWLNMLENWNTWMSRRFPLIKKRCRKGIPSSLRGRAWQLLCGSKTIQMKHSKSYQELLDTEISDVVAEEIDKDLHRQFPFHEMFSKRGGTGQKDLCNVLHAYVAYNPTEGYCQAQAPVAAVLLMHMPAEEAFWCLVAMFEQYIPGYYSQGLESVQMDGIVMQGLLKKVNKLAYNHLEKLNVSPMLYCTEWFMCIFARTLSWPCVLRLWDMFFCEGVKVLFQCGLVLLRSSLGTSAKLKFLPGLYETMEKLRKLDQSIMVPDLLIEEIISLKISTADLEKEHRLQLKLNHKGENSSSLARRSYKSIHNHLSQSTSSLASIMTTNSISVNSSQVLSQRGTIKKVDKKNPVQLRSYIKSDDHEKFTLGVQERQNSISSNSAGHSSKEKT